MRLVYSYVKKDIETGEAYTTVITKSKKGLPVGINLHNRNYRSLYKESTT